MKRVATHVACGLLVGIGVALSARAETIYRWVDDSGRTHLSDVVPEKYRATPRRVESTQFDVSPANGAAAKERAAALEAKASTVGVRPAPVEARTRPAGPAATPRAGSSAPGTDCVAWRKRFNISRDCFAGYLEGDGSLRPGAFQACGDDVRDPTPTCGPENW